MNSSNNSGQLLPSIHEQQGHSVSGSGMNIDDDQLNQQQQTDRPYLHDNNS